MIKPINPATHHKFTFYIKASTVGGSHGFFGPYYMNVGCHASDVTLSDNTGLVNYTTIFTSSSTSAVYTFALPSASKYWCTPISTEIVYPGGGIWTSTAKIIGTGS